MRKALIATGAIALISTVAWALPWDTDMVDSVYKRAFSWKMMTLPEGTISRSRARTPGDRSTVSSRAMKGPEATPTDLANGENLFEIYCTACHGKDGKGKAPVTDNKSGTRYSVPAPTLSGTGNAVKGRSDGYLFFTIRDGSKQMPGYGYAMEDHDIWALVAYLRTMEGAAYTAPAPAQEAK